MKAIIRITLLFVSVIIVTLTQTQAQRVIKGTVYMDGKPAAGINVEAHKGSSMMTSFDGKYEVQADPKTKWIKFTSIALDETQRLDLDENSPDLIDYAFTGELPSNDEQESDGEDVDLRSWEELVKNQVNDYVNELSLYTEFYKQDDYKSALPHWKKIYDKYPKSNINVYIQGGKMYESMIENASTDEEKDKLIGEYVKLYDKRVKHFGQKGYVFGRKGTSWLKYKLHESRKSIPEGEELTKVYKTAYEWLNESVKEQGLETETPVFVLLMQTSKSLFRLGEISKETVVKNYELCNNLLNEIIAKNGDEERVGKAKEIQPVIENIFGTSGAADCEALVNIFEPQFREKGDDSEFIKTMLQRLRRAKCDDSELVEQATIRLYELDPSAEAAFNMARSYVKKDDVPKAKEYYKQAMEQETDQDLLATYYYEYGLFIYAKENALSEARSYARKALDINPNYCDANMLIGDIYVASTRSFSGSDMEKSAIFWLAVDYYNKARRSEDCSVDAAQKASDYRKYFPNKEEAFMEGLQEGQTYKIEGWINESTKVRF